MSEHQRRYGGLFWRLSASYFVATLAAAFIGTYVGRFNGPFGDFRDNPLVRWFNHVGDNSINSGVLFVVLAALVGTLTGVLVSFNLARRLGRISRAAEAWSAGDFAATARDASRDELGQLARDLNRMAAQLQALLTTRQELAVVEERNRLARDLHDTVKQHVFANALLVRAARKQVDRDPAIAKQHLQDAEGLAEQTQHELITLIRALRPAALADKGLLTVLAVYAREWTARTGKAVDLRAQGEAPGSPRSAGQCGAAQQCLAGGDPARMGRRAATSECARRRARLRRGGGGRHRDRAGEYARAGGGAGWCARARECAGRDTCQGSRAAGRCGSARGTGGGA